VLEARFRGIVWAVALPRLTLGSMPAAEQFGEMATSKG
jgi:hypothetical protein